MPLEQKGLTSREAEDRLRKYGHNILPEKSPPSNFYIFLSQLKNPLVYVLVAAGTITLFLNDYSDAVIIFFAVLLNTVLGFFQERRASKALFALRKLIHPEAQVMRNGHKEKIDASDVVPDD